MKRALVTGSAGFVGRHLCRALEADGYDVVGIDLVDAQGDTRDAREFFAVGNSCFDVVVHAAAHVGGRTDIDGRPTFIGAYNLQLDGALFEWALRTRPRRIVYLSSSAVYPLWLQTHAVAARLREGDVDLAEPELPDATYGWVKLTGERLAAEARSEGLRVHVVRPFSGYGTDQDVAYPFGAFRQRALERADPFTVWGNGLQVRDWVHIDDVVGAIMALLDVEDDTTVNLCTGRGESMINLARLFGRAAGYRPSLSPCTGAPAGVQHRVGDPGLMAGIYVPRITIEEGVRRACRR